MAQTSSINKRIETIESQNAQGDLKKIYENIQKAMGQVPNIFKTMANSPNVLKAFLTFSEAANETELSPKLREKIALAVSQANNCNYCLSAHCAIGAHHGLKDQEIMEARKGEAADPKTKAILEFAKIAVEKRAQVTDQDIDKLKSKGVTDKEFVEIFLVIMTTMFTNYFNNLAGTQIDFPEAPKLS